MSDLRQGTFPGLDISDMRIETASITIRMLRLDKGQLSKSLFGQFPKRLMFDEEKVELLGEPWGYVDYDPDHAEKPLYGEVRQFFAPLGNLPYRCPVWIRNLEGHPSEWGRTREKDWPSPLRGMRSHHESLSLCSFLDRAIQGTAVLPEKSPAWRLSLPFPARSPFAGFFVEMGHERQFDEEFLGWIKGAIEPEPIATEPGPVATTPLARIPTVPASDYQRECRERLRQFLESRGFTAGMPREHWESLIERNVAAARDYIARWNALMDKLRSVGQLYIGG